MGIEHLGRKVDSKVLGVIWQERNQHVFQGKLRYGNAGTGNCG